MMSQSCLRRVFTAESEKGAVLVTGLLLVFVLTILSMAAMMSTSAELRIVANDRSAKNAFYLAEAGLEDARTRLQVSASASPIPDNNPTNSNWKVFIGTEEKSNEKGYQSTNSDHARYDKLDSSLDYVVTVIHKLDPSGNILKWGDGNGDGIPEENLSTGENIYVITSDGYTPTGAYKAVMIEAAKAPPIKVPAALYTKADTTIQGTSTYVIGMDGCSSAHVPGIISKATVTQNGNPTITGSPFPIKENSSNPEINVQSMINGFKKNNESYSYNVNSATLRGMNWGSPTPGSSQQDPTSCSTQNVVYFNTNSTYVKLTGGTSGCGLLLVEGDLHVHGGFQWYGVILVTGSIVFAGGGEKNVTGAILSGGSVSADVIGGNAAIVFCSEAVNDQTKNLPLITLRWMELFS